MDNYNVDFGAIDEVLKGILDSKDSFGKYVDMIASGDEKFSFQSVFDGITGIFNDEIGSVKGLFAEMLVIIIIASIFVNFSKAFNSRQVSETGFYVTYMLMFMLISVTFTKLSDVAADILDKLLEFMQALLPSFFLTVTYITGSSTAVVFYQSALVVIGIVDMCIVRIFLPAVNMYFIFAMLNPLLSEDFFSKLIQLMEKLITWGLKSIFTLVAGIGLIQGMVIPAAANMKKGILGKALSSVPGVGNTIGQVAESVYGAGVLIKNAVGAAGLIVIVMICAVPLIRFIVYSLVMQTGAAITQPAANDKRMIECLSAAAKASKMLFYVVGMASVLFIITIAIITLSTGIGR